MERVTTLAAEMCTESAKLKWPKITAPPPIDGSELYWGFITLTGLGLVLTVCAALIR
jgi:hypothetical protein